MNQTTPSSLRKAMDIVRALASAGSQGMRASALCRELGSTPATTHRLLQQLIAEDLVEQPPGGKHYRLSLGLFTLAARAGDQAGLRSLCRPALIRLGAALADSLFLLVRAGFDAVCLDRWEGPFPVRTFTGDIGGRVPLGVGQGALCILAHLPVAEQEEVMRFNVPRIRPMGPIDEVFLRTEIQRVHKQGFANTNMGVIEGMAGVAVPLFDTHGRVVGALSVGTLANRLDPERLPVVVELLQREARSLSCQINPFDPTLRRPAESLGAMTLSPSLALQESSP